MTIKYGLTDSGFIPKPFEVCLAELEARQLANIGPDTDISSESPLGQLNAMAARTQALMWEQLAAVYESGDRDKATGDALVAIGKLTSTVKLGKSYTIVAAQCDLDAGTLLEAGVNYAEVNGDPSSRWTLLNDYTAAVDGPQDVLFRADKIGAVPLALNSLTIIATAVTGWNSIENLAPATIGREIDTDEIFRGRIDESNAETGKATAHAIKKYVEDSDPDKITSVEVFNNRSDTTDANGLPPHSVEVLVFDGLTPLADNDDIAQAIIEVIGATTNWHGDEIGTAIDKNTDLPVTVKFSRPAVTAGYIDITVTGSDIDIPALKTYLATETQKLVTGSGVSIRWREADDIALKFSGVTGVTSYGVGSTASPTPNTDFAVDLREIVYFDATNISVTVA